MRSLVLNWILLAAASLTSASSVPRGFVQTKGTHFELDGKPFYFAGTNSYWAQYTTNLSDTAIIFERAHAAGLNVLRTWVFSDANATFIPDGLPKYNPDNFVPGQIVFQTFENGKATINTGPTGLQHLDKLVALAEQHGIKLIMTLTNNWADFGGMDVYTVNVGGQFHDEFFYNPKVISMYKTYVETIVSRYKNSPAVFAWELANEPRCGADPSRSLLRSASSCSPSVLTNWADNISTFIKSIDPHHLISLGDEGFFFENNPNDWAYNGTDGVDFTGNLKLKNLDFGTFHLYPVSWTKTAEWGNQFIIDHATQMRNVGKPVIWEEYGWPTPLPANSLTQDTRVNVIGSWQKTQVEQRISGDMFWQFGLLTGLSTGPSTNDGNTIFLENRTESVPLIFDHVKAVNRLNH